MAVRTTAAAIGKIIEVDATVSTDLVPFIEVANALVTELCSDSGYTDARLELIERWLSAHFYAVRDPRTSSESAGVSVSYQGQTGMHLDLTTYGQQAMLLDTDGNLAALNQKPKAGIKTVTPGITWLGTEDEDDDE